MIETVIGHARRRFIVNEVVAKSALSATLVTAGVAAILIFGIRWLEWWVLVPLGATAAAYAVLSLRQTVPSRYAAAIRLDRAAHLNDSLSTALHFAARREPFAQVQRTLAEEAARSVDVSAVVPFTIPRSLYGLGAMVVAAAALIAVRYGASHTLDLSAPITEVIFEDQAAHRPAKKASDEREALRRKNLETAESLLAKMGVPVDPEQARNQQGLDRAIEQALAPPANAGAEKGQKGEAPGKAENGNGGNGADPQQQPGDPMDEKAAIDPSAGENKNGADKGSPKGGSGDNSSLLSKLKDAVSNMLSKATQNKESGGQKNSSQQQDQSAKSGKGKTDKASGKGQQGEPSDEAQEGQPDGDAKDGQEAQSKAASKSSQQSGQSGSGVGNQDGSKDLRAAEQLRAMGKLSEIIGKRAATVTGETMIEVQSGNQKLTTAYSNKSAAHHEAAGDVSRDEIPVALQPYVRQYFEQVHKSAAAPKTAVR